MQPIETNAYRREMRETNHRYVKSRTASIQSVYKDFKTIEAPVRVN